MSSGGALILSGEAIRVVGEGWDLFPGLAITAFDQALTISEELSTFDIAPVTYDTSFTPPPNSGLVWNRPERPETPEIAPFNFQLPPPLELDIPEIQDVGDVPEFAGTPPVLDFGVEPQLRDYGDLPDSPILDTVELPDAPTLLFPDDPQLTDVVFPDPPELLDIEFDGLRPDAPDEAHIPDANIDFTEELYSSDQLDRLRDEIQRMMETGTGMPAIVEQMLVDRFQQRHDRGAVRAVQEAFDETAARGFSLPQGITLRRVQEARQNNQNQNAETSRDVFIQRRTEEIENFRFAVSQALACENMLIQAHLNVMQRAFDYARAVADLAFRVLDARIAVYNAAIQGYIADAQVYEARLRAEIQKLERYRLLLQAESLKQEVDRNKIALYTAKLEALQRVVDIYVAQVNAARAIADKNNAEVRAYIGQIEGFRAKIEANRAEFQAWETKVRGQLGRSQVFESEVRAFLARVQAYDASVRAVNQRPQLEIQIEELRTREALANIERARTQIREESVRAQLAVSIFGGEAQLYSADGQMAANETAARDRNFLSALESKRAESQQALAQAQLDVEQVLRTAQILVSAKDSAGRVGAQLSAGMASAMNLGANVGYSEGINISTSLGSSGGSGD